MPAFVAVYHRPKPVDGQRACGVSVFCDCRPVGGEPAFLLTSKTRLTAADIAQSLGLSTPPGFGVQVKGDVVCENQVFVRSGCVTAVHYVVRAPLSSSGPASDVEALAGAGSVSTAEPAVSLHDVPDRDAYAPVGRATSLLTDVPSAGRVRCGVLIFTPRFHAEAVSVEVPTPCDVGDLLSAVHEQRSEERAHVFASLLPVDPQPAHDFACLLAFPEWAAAETLILVDARPLDGRLFCCETKGALSRSSFLLQIGVEDRPGLCITVAGDAWPSGVLLTFEIGALVSLFATSDSGPQALSLDDFLSAPPDETWPCPRYHGPVASAFWVGTDGGFRILAYQPGPGTSSSDFIARAVQALSHREYATTLCSASPAISDISHMGQDCRAAVVLTERLPYVPVPPGRVCVPQHVIFLDRRAILRDLIWIVADRGVLDFELLTAEYDGDRPPGFTLVVRGGQLQSRDGRVYVSVAHRGALTFEFLRNSSQDPSEPPNDEEANGPPEEDAESSDSTSDPSEYGGPAMPIQGPRGRSRSPRHGGRVVQTLPPAGPLWVGPISKPLRFDPIAGILALLSEMPNKMKIKGSLCSLGLEDVGAGLFAGSPHWLGCNLTWSPTESAWPSLKVCPAGAAADHHAAPSPAQLSGVTVSTASTGASAERGDGPPVGGPAHAGIGPGQDSAVDGPAIFAAAHFLVLAPDYVPEMINIRIPVPISEDIAFGMIDGARDPTCRDRFPRLCPVYPQPWGQAALVLAAPLWGFSGILVACDLSAINGAFFSTVVPRQITKEMVLRAAGLDPVADVALFIRDVPWAIPAGVACEVEHGDLIQVLPRDHPVVVLASLSDMLRSDAGWDPDWLPPGQFEEAVWVLAGRDQFRYAIPPFRRQYLRHDLANILGTPARELILRHAVPQFLDCAPRGLLTQHVIVAVGTDNGRHFSNQRHPICILDLRAVLRGFAWYAVPNGILYYSVLYQSLGRFCPAGYAIGRVDAAGRPTALETHTRIHDGEVLRVTFYIPPPADLSCSEEDDDDQPPGAHMLDSDASGTATTASGPAATVVSSAGSGSPGTGGQSTQHALSTTSLSPVYGCEGVGSEMWGWRSMHDALDVSHATLTSFLHSCVEQVSYLASRQASLFRYLAMLFLRAVAFLMATSRSLGTFYACWAFWFFQGAAAMPLPLQPRGIPTPCRNVCLGRGPAPAQHSPESRESAGPVTEGPRCAQQPASRAWSSPGPTIAEDSSHRPPPLWQWKRGLKLPSVRFQAEQVLGADLDRPLRYGDTPLGFTLRHLHSLFRPDFRCLSVQDCLGVLGEDKLSRFRSLIVDEGQSLPAGLVCFTDGSFIPATASSDAKAGWSCIFFNRQLCTCDIIAGSLPGWCVAGHDGLSAFKAECCALIVALWLGTSVSQGASFRIFSDCQAALAIAQGVAAPHQAGVSVALGNVAECCRAVSHAPPLLHYSPGHRGILGNELADIAAKSAAEGVVLGTLVWSLGQARRALVVGEPGL